MFVMNYKEKLSSLKVNLDFARKQVTQESVYLEKAKTLIVDTQQAQSILQEIAEYIQNQAHLQISNIVTRCLRAIFGEESYDFKIIFEQKRGKTEARLVFIKDDIELDPLEDSAGGYLDVASFALRLAALLLTKPSHRKVLVLDEPMRNLHGDKYQNNCAELIENLAEEFDIQLIICTADDWLKMGKIIEL